MKPWNEVEQMCKLNGKWETRRASRRSGFTLPKFGKNRFSPQQEFSIVKERGCW